MVCKSVLIIHKRNIASFGTERFERAIVEEDAHFYYLALGQALLTYGLGNDVLKCERRKTLHACFRSG